MIAASSSEIVFCERTSILSRNRLTIFLGILHILPLAGHMAEVPHPSFIGLRPWSPFIVDFGIVLCPFLTLGLDYCNPVYQLCVSRSKNNPVLGFVPPEEALSMSESPCMHFCLWMQDQLLVRFCGTVRDIRPVSPRSSTIFTASGSCWVLTGAGVLHTSDKQQDSASRAGFCFWSFLLV